MHFRPYFQSVSAFSLSQAEIIFFAPHHHPNPRQSIQLSKDLVQKLNFRNSFSIHKSHPQNFYTNIIKRAGVIG